MNLINKYIFIAYTTCSLLIISCSDEKGSHMSSKESLNRIKKISVNHANNDSTIFLSDFINGVKIIPLEFNKQCILGGIKKIVIDDSSIYIQDIQNSGGIFRFNKDGKFICKIGRLGKGPSEHINLTDFSINPDTKSIYIYSNSQRKVFEYTVDNRFIKEKLLNYAAENFEYKDNRFYLYRENPQLDEKYNFIIKDMDGKTVARYFKSEPDKRSFSAKVFSLSKGHLLLYRHLNDTIYGIKGDNLEYVYNVDYGNHSLSKEDRLAITKWSSNILKIMNSNNYISGMDNLILLKNTMFFTYVYQNIENRCFYNTRTNKLVNSYSIIDDLSGFSFSSPISQTDECFVSIYDPSSIENNIRNINLHASKLLPTEIAKAAIAKLESLKKTDPSKMNPIIMLYEIK